MRLCAGDNQYFKRKEVEAMEKINSYRFIGVDTHKDQHTAAVIDCFGQCLGIVEIPNNPNYFDELINQIKVYTNGHQLAFGLEDTGGLGRSLAHFLTTSGMLVKEVNPTLTERRRRTRPHPEKSDPQDALSIAKTLRDEFDSLPDVSSNELYVAIRDLSLHRDSLVKEQTKLKNRFHSLVRELYPMYESMFKNPFSKAALAFWQRFPAPSALMYIGTKRLASFLRKHSNNTVSTKRAEEILKVVEPSSTSSLLEETRASIIKDIVARISSIQNDLEKINAQLKILITKTDYKLSSLTGVDTAVSAKIISSVGNINRFSSASKLAKFAGIAPLDKSSGRKRRYKKSNRGHRSLNNAIYYLALCQITKDPLGRPNNPLALAYYQRKLTEGKTKKEALTCLMRRLCDVIFRLMKNGSVYVMPSF
jgi:transposase